MGPFLQKGSLFVVLASVFAAATSASPLSSRLLSLVPPGAEVVAGFENHAGPTSHGRLLLTTHNNRLDLDDFQALTGVDSKRVFDEVVQVAMARSGGGLSEHMLLVAGRFDRERIFGAVQGNGAETIKFLDEKVLLIKPFAREQGDMLDTRWFVILDNRTTILGTACLVQKAIRRYADHAVPDPVLQERLTLLHHDVTSWNVLVGSPKSSRNLTFMHPHSAWAQLQQDADLLMVAARFGSKIRVDFSIQADAAYGPDFFNKKAEVFTDALAEARPGLKSAEPADRRLANFALETNRVQGSVELSNQQFAAWCDHLYLAHTSAPSPTNGN